MAKRIVIPPVDGWDVKRNRFVYFGGATIMIEHSLVSLKKWEQKWHIPFLSKKEKTIEQVKDYIRCMTITQNVDDIVYEFLTEENYREIYEYIEDPMTATWFSDDKGFKPLNQRVLTNEVIYCYMFALNIPMECQKWHLNSLITLIKVCNEENKPKKKSKPNDLYKKFNEINDARHAKYGS